MMLLAKNALIRLNLALCAAGLAAAIPAHSAAQTPKDEVPGTSDFDKNTAPGTLLKPEKNGVPGTSDFDKNTALGTSQDFKNGPPAALEQVFEAPETVEVGDRLTLKLAVEHPEGARVHLPEALPNPRWELGDVQEVTHPLEGKYTTELTLTLQLFRPGESTLGAFDVMVLGENGAVTTLKTEPISTKVVSILPAEETPELKAARKPVAVWTVDYTPLWVGGGLGAALLLGAAGFIVARRRRPEPAPPPPRPAHVVALEKLSALTDAELLDSGEYMLYYVRLSETIREYLGRRYAFRGTELTTTEILAHLSRVESGEGWPRGLSFEDVRDWLYHCDLIKFSDATPARQESDQALRRAFTIVELTRDTADEIGDEQAPTDAENSSEDNAKSAQAAEKPAENEQTSEFSAESDEKPAESDDKDEMLAKTQEKSKDIGEDHIDNKNEPANKSARLEEAGRDDGSVDSDEEAPR